MDNGSRVKLYREQAEACARAARTTPDLREAYLDLERGWLRLAEQLEQEELEERQRASGE